MSWIHHHFVKLSVCVWALSCSKMMIFDRFPGVLFGFTWCTSLWYCALIFTPYGRQSTWITLTESKNTLDVTLSADNYVLNFVNSGGPLWCHSTRDFYDSGMKQCSHISSQVTLRSRNMFPSSSNWCRCSTDIAMCCAFCLTLTYLGPTGAHFLEQ